MKDYRETTDFQNTQISTTEKQSSERVLIERDLFGREEKQLHRCLADSSEATENADKKTGWNEWVAPKWRFSLQSDLNMDRKTNKQTNTRTHTHKLQHVPRVMKMISELNKKKLLAPKDLGKILALWWFFKNLQN